MSNLTVTPDSSARFCSFKKKNTSADTEASSILVGLSALRASKVSAISDVGIKRSGEVFERQKFKLAKTAPFLVESSNTLKNFSDEVSAAAKLMLFHASSPTVPSNLQQAQQNIYSQFYEPLKEDLELVKPEDSEIAKPIIRPSKVECIGSSTSILSESESLSFIDNLGKISFSKSFKAKGLCLVTVYDFDEYERIKTSLNKGRKFDKSTLLEKGAFGAVHMISDKVLSDGADLLKMGSPYKFEKEERANLRKGIGSEIDFWRSVAKTPEFYALEGEGMPSPLRPKLIVTLVEKEEDVEHIQRYCIVLPYLGADLLSFHQKLVAQNKTFPFSMKQIAGGVQSLLEELVRLHAFGYIHRDLKVENVVIELDDQGNPKLDSAGNPKMHWIDPGAAIKIQPNQKPNSFAGSRDEHPPEIVMCCSYGQEVDVYSFMCTVSTFCIVQRSIELKKEIVNPKAEPPKEIPYARINHLRLQIALTGQIPQALLKVSHPRMQNLLLFEATDGRMKLKPFKHYSYKRGDFSVSPRSFEYINQELGETEENVLVKPNPEDPNKLLFQTRDSERLLSDSEIKKRELVRKCNDILRSEKAMFLPLSERVKIVAEKRKYPKEHTDLFIQFLARGFDMDPSKRPSFKELLDDPFIKLASRIEEGK